MRGLEDAGIDHGGAFLVSTHCHGRLCPASPPVPVGHLADGCDRCGRVADAPARAPRAGACAWIVAFVLALLAGCVCAPGADAVRRPSIADVHVILERGRPLSCPDPSVIRSPVAAAWRYYVACTSDRELNALPIRGLE